MNSRQSGLQSEFLDQPELHSKTLLKKKRKKFRMMVGLNSARMLCFCLYTPVIKESL